MVGGGICIALNLDTSVAKEINLYLKHHILDVCRMNVGIWHSLQHILGRKVIPLYVDAQYHSCRHNHKILEGATSDNILKFVSEKI